jgi:glutaredoxin
MRVVVYTADWCGPCKKVKGLFTRAGFKPTYVDVDEEPNEAAKMGVRGIPVTIVYDGEREVQRFVGAISTLVDKLKGLGVEI